MTEDYRYPEELKEEEYKKAIERMKDIEKLYEKDKYCTCYSICPHCGKPYRYKGGYQWEGNSCENG